MLADHVVSEVFGLLDVEFQGLVRRGGIEAVRPPALVQRTIVEDMLPIETQPFITIFIDHHAHRTHGRIARYLIHLILPLAQAQPETVQIGCIRGPQLRIRNSRDHRLSGSGNCGRDPGPVGREDFHLHRRIQIFVSGAIHRYREGTAFRIGDCFVIRDVCSGNGLHPHALPDTGYRCVPDSPRHRNLLAAGLEIGIGGIGHLYPQLLLFSLVQIRGDIEAEMGISARMGTHQLVVYINLCEPVHRLKIQHHATLAPRIRNGKDGLIPKGLLLRDAFSHARKSRFHAERNQDRAVTDRMLFFLRDDGILP